MEADNSSSGMYRPCVEPAAQSQRFDDGTTVSPLGLETSDKCTSVQNMDDSQLVGVPVAVAGDNTPATANVIGSEKRKRGRPPRSQAAKTPPPKRPREAEEEEDVCFICFDGGSLVLCDRKGCPKAYHPACIKRDEAFFRSKAKWNCGWHICSVCQKASHYLCYTCTYSLCKACTKSADYLCVRGNKGFCSTCMRTIMLIENKDQGNKEMVQVDFDDKSSWEYLFKVYWVLLKEKLSLTLSELIQAKNPWKESDAVHGKRKLLPYGHCVANDGKGLLDKSFDSLGLKKPKEPLELPYKNPPSTENRTTEFNNNTIPSSSPESELTKLEFKSKGCLNTEQASTIVGKSVNGCTEWASKELLDFVAHMKDGDTSALSQFDVQALLLDYIKRYNLRDPRQKSQIICDLRLKSLFGKPRVGHIEMLKLLEYHILTMEEPKKSAFIPAGIVGTVTSHVDPDAKNDISSLTNSNKKRKSRRNGEVKLTPINLDEYAAIDAHNINIIYLRRDLMENLAEDVEKFHDKVVGSVVRIRIPGNDQKQEIYRLVHVVGTCKSSVPYKIGNKTVDVLLEVLNLDKKEALSIDSISNQDFSEDECRRLRQSIKCGLVKRLTIGEIQKKAMELRAVKLNDSLEAEKLRLNHLRDRASENGRKKELRECVEKLELLQTLEERQRRLLESPEVHADPKMDPNYESEGDGGEYVDKRKVEYSGPRCTRFSTRKEKLVYSGSQVKEEGPITAQCKASEKREAHGTNILEKLGNQLTVDQVVDRSGSENSLASLSMPNSSSTNNSEIDQVWHYRDPSGRMQGPFSIMQLRKWNTSGLFPPDMRIWTNHEHRDSVLLINGLKGLCHKSPDNRNSVGWSESVTGTGGECGESEVPRHLHNASNHSNGNFEFTRTDRLSPSLPQCLDLLKGNSSCCDKQQLSTPVPSSRQREVIIALPHQERGHANANFHCALGLVTPDSRGSIMCQTTDGNDHDMQSKSQSYLGASSAQNRGSFTSNRSSINLDSGPSFASVTKSSDTFEQKEKMNHLPDLPSPTPETSYSDLETQAAEKLLSLSSDVHLRASDIQELPSPTPISKGEAQGGQTAANKPSVPSSLPVQESGPSWSSPPTLVIFGAQFREIADDWGKYSPAAKPSTEEWDSGLVSGSSLKPAEAVVDHVARHTSNADQLNHTSPSHPVLNLSSWQAGSGPIEFSTLAEESVSDLLAEVDAMEFQTQNGMGSPTSAMRCGEEMIPGCKNDCFSSIEELSPTPDPAKSDALSSSGEIQLHCRSTVADEPVRASLADAFDPLKRSGANSSTSSEGETKSANVQFTQGVAGSNIPAPCTTSQNTAFSAMGQNMGLEGMASARGAAPGNMTWGGPVQGFANIAMDGSMGATWGNSHMNRGPPFPGNPVWDSQRRSGGERPGGPRDWTLQGGDSGRGRSSGNRQQPYGNRQQPYGGSGGYSRPPPKGHRICKFYESGRCKKGASCDYLHP